MIVKQALTFHLPVETRWSQFPFEYRHNVTQTNIIHVLLLMFETKWCSYNHRSQWVCLWNVNFISCRKKKHLSCWWAPLTQTLSEVTTVINEAVELRGSETKWFDPAALVGCLWWLKAGPHAVKDRWPHWGPSAHLKT